MEIRWKFCGKDTGSGTDLWRVSEEVRAGKTPEHVMFDLEVCSSRSSGHCNTMGTASTMASMAEALGITLPCKNI